MPRYPDPPIKNIYWLMVIFGTVLALFIGGDMARQAIAAQSWVAVECEILSSGVSSFTAKVTDADRLLARRETIVSAPVPSLSVSLSYKYRYNGREYFGDRYRLQFTSRAGFGAQAAMEKTVAALPRGARTACWVDPTNPLSSVMDRSVNWPWLAFGFAPLILAAAGVRGLLGIRRKRIAAA